MFRKILLAYDGSAGAKRALDVALELASLSHAELWALAVEERLPHYTATVGEAQEAKEFANHYFQEVSLCCVPVCAQGWSRTQNRDTSRACGSHHY